MLGHTDNQMLQQAEAAIAAKVTPDMQGPFKKIVDAGLQIMYSPGGAKIMQQQLTKPGDPVSNVAEGAAKLMGEMLKQSKGTMPMKAAIPAATVLMMEGLDFLEKAHKIEVNNQVIAAATKDFGAFALQILGVDKNKLQQMTQRAQAQQAQDGAAPGAAPAAPTAPPGPGLIAGAQPQGAM